MHADRFNITNKKLAKSVGSVAPWLAATGHADYAWLARAGRFAQPQSAANTLGAVDDAQALALFLG